MMRVAITGATGVLGSALARALCQRGDEVVALSRRPQDLGPRLRGLPIAAYPYHADGLRMAIADGKIDALVHCACAYGRAGESDAELLEANAHLPLRMVEAAGKDVGRWIAIGTGLPATVSPYAQSKQCFAEGLARATAPASRVVVKLEHFYGPGDDANKFISKVIRQCLADQTIPLTTGTQERDFIHLDDVLRALLLIIDTDTGPGCSTMALGSGKGVSIRSVVEQIQTLAGGGNPVFGEVAARPNEPLRCVADPAWFLSHGWSPQISLHDGLTNVVHAERQLLESQ